MRINHVITSSIYVEILSHIEIKRQKVLFLSLNESLAIQGQGEINCENDIGLPKWQRDIFKNIFRYYRSYQLYIKVCIVRMLSINLLHIQMWKNYYLINVEMVEINNMHERLLNAFGKNTIMYQTILNGKREIIMFIHFYKSAEETISIRYVYSALVYDDLTNVKYLPWFFTFQDDS